MSRATTLFLISSVYPMFCVHPAKALTNSGPITISGQNGTIIDGLHVTSTSGSCITVTNSTNITIRNSEIGPCGSGTGHGVYISGGNNVNVYDNYIHPEASGSGGYNTGDGVSVNDASTITIQGNVIAWGENGIGIFGGSAVSVIGNFLFQPRGTSSLGGSHIQVWSGSANASNITVTNNYALNCSNDSRDPQACSSIPSAQRTLYPSRREDAMNFGYADTITLQNNFLAGHPDSTSGCGITGDLYSSNMNMIGNRMLDTGAGVIFADTNTGIMDGNKVLSRFVPPSGYCSGAFTVWKWSSTAGPCGNATLRNNVGATYNTGGGEAGYWTDGNCGTVVGISPNQNNTFDAAARSQLTAATAFQTAPLIPPQPYQSVAVSPFTNNPGASGTAPPPPSPCDVDQDGSTTISDVQLEISVALGTTTCTPIYDINKDGACNVVDVRRIINAALGGVCVSP